MRGGPSDPAFAGCVLGCGRGARPRLGRNLRSQAFPGDQARPGRPAGVGVGRGATGNQHRAPGVASGPRGQARPDPHLRLGGWHFPRARRPLSPRWWPNRAWKANHARARSGPRAPLCACPRAQTGRPGPPRGARGSPRGQGPLPAGARPLPLVGPVAATPPADQGRRFALRWDSARRELPEFHVGCKVAMLTSSPTPGPELCHAGVAAPGRAKQLTSIRQGPENSSGTTAGYAEDEKNPCRPGLPGQAPPLRGSVQASG